MKTFEIFESKAKLREDKQLKACLKLCEGLMRILEADDGENDFGIEWEPQPEFKGKGGITTDTGAGMQKRREHEVSQQQAKFKATWDRLQQAYNARRKTDPEGAKKLYGQLQQLQNLAKQKGMDLQLSTPAL